MTEPQLTSPSQKSQPDVGVWHNPEWNGHPIIRSGDDSDSESDVSDRQQRSKWPENEANEMAQWRHKAMAKRAIFDRTAAAERPNLNQVSDNQVHGNTSEIIDTSKASDEPLMGASAVNAQSDSREIWGPNSVSLVQTASDAENAPLNEMNWKRSSQGPNAVSDLEGTAQDLSVASNACSVCSARLDRGSKSFPADQAEHKHDRALNEFRPTMSESLNAITERFLNIDALDERQDVSRFIAYLLDTVELLSSKVAFLQAKDANGSIPRSVKDSQSLQSPGGHANVFVGKVLHRVLCSIRSHQHHNAYYEDKPTYRYRHSGRERKLMGDNIVHSLDNYLALQSNLSFIVVNDHHCTGYAQYEGSTGGDIRQQTERLRIVAPLLQEALFKVAEYCPTGRYLTPGHNILKQEGMDAPYPFLFHHHRRLVELALDEMYEGVLSPLLGFLATNYSKEYEEASSLFEEGMVRGRHLSKLFKPNQMVISRQESNVLEAHILYECYIHTRGQIHLAGWSWKYDGNQLQRQPWSQDIDGVLDGRMRIADLKVHPADFARAEDITNLQKRGRIFWNMRDQAYACYTGWDKARQYHYVCATPPCPLSALLKLWNLNVDLNAVQAEERFMVDMATYQLMHPTSDPMVPQLVEDPVSVKLDPWLRKVDKTKELSGKTAMLLPGTIFGFRLQAKKWSERIPSSCYNQK